jgi:hypothetical protein
MSDALILGGVVAGFFVVFALYGIMIEKYGWVGEEKDRFDKEF